MIHILKCLDSFSKNIRDGFFLLLDYDGTLTPIMERPELAILHLDMKKLLKRLASQFKVAIISGRSLSDLKKLVALTGIYYMGNHGLEINGPSVEFVLPGAKRTRPIISKLCNKLRKELKHIHGAIVDDKELTVSVHYRLVPRKELRALKSIFEEVVGPHVASGFIMVTKGKKVFEVRPNVDWGKGKAALWIINLIDPMGKLTPIYIGDDKTDEDAFLAIKDRGITILVSGKRKKSHAKFFLRDESEVKTFFKKLASMK